jgi:adenylate cyclase
VHGKSRIAFVFKMAVGHSDDVDLWGDTVNVASRLQTTAAIDRIQVSAPVADAIGGAFALEERGLTPLKGKGEMPTWLVRGPLLA